MALSVHAPAGRPADLAGGVVGLVSARGVASAQFAAAARLLKIGTELSGPAAKLTQSASQSLDAQGDALAALATGLGEMLDVYA